MPRTAVICWKNHWNAKAVRSFVLWMDWWHVLALFLYCGFFMCQMRALSVSLSLSLFLSFSYSLSLSEMHDILQSVIRFHQRSCWSCKPSSHTACEWGRCETCIKCSGALWRIWKTLQFLYYAVFFNTGWPAAADPADSCHHHNNSNLLKCHFRDGCRLTVGSTAPETAGSQHLPEKPPSNLSFRWIKVNPQNM